MLYFITGSSSSKSQMSLPDKTREPGISGPVFGVPLGQCVDLPAARKRSTCALTATGIDNIPSSQDELLLSPVIKASRSDSRASFCSVSGGQPPTTADSSRLTGSTESLFDFRRQSLGLSSQSSAVLDTLSMDEVAELSMLGTHITFLPYMYSTIYTI